MKTCRIPILLIATVILFTNCKSTNLQSEKVNPVPDRLKWFNDAKFGMFIHWGPYAGKVDDASWPVMLNQISEEEYSKFPESFNPTRFNPDEWVKLAQEAGQRYLVFTTKHTDGFCMFDTKLTDYRITNTPYKKDVLSMLVTSARKVEMPLGFYYCPIPRQIFNPGKPA